MLTPFTLDDLDRISARVGMSDKTLRQMSDTQFTAWLRAHGAQGVIGVVTTAPGHLEIPMASRVQALNDLQAEGFYIPGVMGDRPAVASAVSDDVIRTAQAHLESAARALENVAGLLGEIGEVDARVNMRASVHGAMELVELLSGALQHARRTRTPS